MSLRSKILLIVFLVLMLGACVDCMLDRLVIMPHFVELETTKAKTNITRCTEAIQSEIDHLSRFIADWAYWDDSYVFAIDHNQNFINSNLNIVTFKESNLNLLYICDLKGSVVWGRIYDQRQQPINLKEFPADSLPSDHPAFLCCRGAEPEKNHDEAGLLMTQRGPMLFATKPILTSQKTGPAHGFIVMGRFLDDVMTKKLIGQTKVNFAIFPIEKFSDTASRAALKHIADTNSPYIRQLDNDRLEIYTTFADIKGTSALLLCADMPREIYQGGKSAMSYTMFSGLSVNIAVLAVLLFLLQFTVVGPLLKLANHTVRIAQSDNLTTRLNMERNDEIGILAKGFDSMLEQLSKARTELIERSYKWGKAEMASGVLHNLRNSLSPVVARIDFMREDIQKAPLENIQTAQAQLAREDTSPQRKADLQKFLELANNNLESLCRRMKEELEDLAGRTLQIEKMLGSHDILTHNGCPAELTTVRRLVEDGLKMMDDSLCKDISINITPSISQIGQFKCDRILLSQIFANLLTNAAESIRRAGVHNGSIAIDANVEKIDSLDMVHVRVTDNGCGIPPQDLERLFQRGFSTKPEQDFSGIGLHWCANTVGAMQGRLWAQSSGIGQGACIHLLLPFQAQKNPPSQNPEIKA